jgi:CubicO group peptidase (beta-lactamase class C family)
LTHTSGLRSDIYLEYYGITPERAKQLVIKSSLYCRPGRCYNYSDLGAIILGIIVERITGQSLNTFVQDSIFVPMGMTHTMYNPPTTFCGFIVWTEKDHNECGIVNDGNSQALGGVAGHAGLFSSGGDLAIFAQMMLNHGRVNGVQFFDSAVVDLFTTEVKFKRALGWVVYKGKVDGKIIGHMGYTGTMMLLDMTDGLFVIVLTNRAINNTRRSSFIYVDQARDSISNVFFPNFSLEPKPKPRRHSSRILTKSGK